MASSDDDDDLKRAIAMSLADAGPDHASSTVNNVVDLTSDNDTEDEDEDLRRAIALSLSQTQKEMPIDSVMGSQVESVDSPVPQYASTTASQIAKSTQLEAANSSLSKSTVANPKPSGLLGLDRSAMEQERLARLGKRKRSASPDCPSKLVVRAPSESTLAIQNKVNASSNSGMGVQYPKGIVKRTWAHKHTRTNDIKIEEVLQASSINIAVLSAFQWDNVWLFENKIDPYKTKQIWVMSAKGDFVRDKLRKEMQETGIPENKFKLCFPPMDGQVNCMHSKLMLLFHADYLRVVVPTANMVKTDWGETNTDPRTGKSWQPAVMENTVFLIDLPRKSDATPAKEAETAFGNELIYFLRAQEVGRNVVDGVLKHDFSETQHLAFVHSIGGNHSGAARNRTGLPALSTAIRKLKLDNVEKLELDYTTSSLGSVKEPFLKQIYLAASGLSTLSGRAPSDFLDKFRIYFPTKDTVVNSTGGVRCGGIISLLRSYYDNPAFPRKCLRDYKSTRPGILSHNKLLLARGCKKDGTPFAWVYIGSANISESAWGAHKLLKSGVEGKLNIKNWECGVVVPVPEEKLNGLKLVEGEVPPMSVFKDTVEVPFQYPGEKYEGKEPWFFQEGS